MSTTGNQDPPFPRVRDVQVHEGARAGWTVYRSAKPYREGEDD